MKCEKRGQNPAFAHVSIDQLPTFLQLRIPTDHNHKSNNCCIFKLQSASRELCCRFCRKSPEHRSRSCSLSSGVRTGNRSITILSKYRSLLEMKRLGQNNVGTVQETPNPYNLSEKYWQYTSNLYHSTPPICNAVPYWPPSLEERETPQYTSHLCRSTPPICTQYASHLY